LWVGFARCLFLFFLHSEFTEDDRDDDLIGSPENSFTYLQ